MYSRSGRFINVKSAQRESPAHPRFFFSRDSRSETRIFARGFILPVVSRYNIHSVILKKEQNNVGKQGVEEEGKKAVSFNAAGVGAANGGVDLRRRLN